VHAIFASHPFESAKSKNLKFPRNFESILHNESSPIKLEKRFIFCSHFRQDAVRKCKAKDGRCKNIKRFSNFMGISLYGGLERVRLPFLAHPRSSLQARKNLSQTSCLTCRVRSDASSTADFSILTLSSPQFLFPLKFPKKY
jgi:hypothetical protein